MGKNTYLDLHLTDLSSLPPSSPPFSAASDPSREVQEDASSPLSALFSSQDVQENSLHQQQLSTATLLGSLHIEPLMDTYTPVTVTKTPPQYQGRELVGGEGSDPGVFRSSLVLTKQDQKKKMQTRKQDTWKMKKQQWEEKEAIKKAKKAQEEAEQKAMAIKCALCELKNASVTFTKLCLHVFNPQDPMGMEWRWNNFYKFPEAVNNILTWMASQPNSKLACQTVAIGMTKVVENIIV